MSRIYMLDTDTCIFILRRSVPALLSRIQSVPLQEQAISVVTLAELLYGVQESSKKKTNQAGVDALVRHVAVMEWPARAAAHYAEIRADLKRKGQSIGANDLMIAAHARSEGAIVVTNNVKGFGRVKGLKVENWT
ncbi:MAG: PIN domain-containing protein [Rhodocyclales bacterium]|nr:PIN domain-containing protein [Rhodocyclales bacterium]